MLTVGVNERLARGLTAFQIGNYTEAAIVLLDIVDDARFQASVAFDEALYHLAESLYRNKNYFGAMRHFLQLVERGGRRWRPDALRRLIALAFQERRYADIETLWALLVKTNALGDDVDSPYLRAKALYNIVEDIPQATEAAVKEGRRARDAFLSIPLASPFLLRARFHVVALWVREGKYKEAIAAAVEALKLAPATEEERRVVDLLNLALGRVFHDLKDYKQAEDYYTRIRHTSDVFDESLFELAWVHVKAKNFKQALRTADVLMLLPDSPLLPRARLLQGNLHLHLAEYEKADKTYEEIIQLYKPLQDEMAKFVSKAEAADGFFRRMITENLDKFDFAAIFPKIASRWVKKDLDVSKAVSLIADVRGNEASLREIDRILSHLESSLRAPNKIDIFPDLRDARARALGYENSILMMRRQLTQVEAKLFAGKLSEAEQAELVEIRKRIATWEEKYKDAPKTREDYLNRRLTSEARFRKQDHELFRLLFELEGRLAQVVALVKYFNDTKKSRGISEDQERIFISQIDLEQKTIREMIREIETARKETARGIAQLSLEDNAAEDANVREKLKEALAGEQAFLRQLRSRLSGEAARLAEKADDDRTTMDTLSLRLREFQSRLRREVEKKVIGLQARVNAERKEVWKFRRESKRYSGESETLAGKVAHETFDSVRRRIGDLVVEADVGLIDVVWKKKEDNSKKYTGTLQDREREMKTLEKDFKELRSEDDDAAAAESKEKKKP